MVAPFLYINVIKGCEIVKTNQFHGAWTGAIIKTIFPKKLFVVRGGYIWGEVKLERKGNLIKDVYNIVINKIYFILIKFALSKADAIFLTSERDKNVLLSIYKQSLNKKICYIYNSIDTEKFSSKLNKEFFNKNKELKMITVARLEKMKNIQSLILALSEFRNFELTVIGDGPFKSHLQKISRENGIPTTYLGNVPNDELPSFLQRADIFVMPQLYGSGISKVILEAMACGNIVIASDIGAHKVVVKDAYNGFLSGTSPASIKRCLEKVINYDKAKLMEISTNAVKTIQSLYSMGPNAKKEFQIYREILQ
jgi:glycosyltransferase involved in cell wall biosynthesis